MASSEWNPHSPFATPYSPVLRRLLLRADQLAVDQHFRDLDRVERSALAQVVGHAPQHEAILHRRVLADAADIGRVLAGRLIRRGIAAGLLLVDDEAAGRLAQDLAGFIRGDRVLELDIDGLGMADE